MPARKNLFHKRCAGHQKQALFDEVAPHEILAGARINLRVKTGRTTRIVGMDNVIVQQRNRREVKGLRREGVQNNEGPHAGFERRVEQLRLGKGQAYAHDMRPTFAKWWHTPCLTLGVTRLCRPSAPVTWVVEAASMICVSLS